MSSDEEEQEVPAAACHEDQEGQRKKKAASKRFENAIETWLQEYGGLLRHQFETEEQQIGKRARKSTPDFLITDESACLRINGVSLRWLEAKCYCLPCQGEKRKKVMEQAQKYVREGLGPGLVIFSHGYVRCVPHEEGISGLLERGWLFVDWQDRPFELQPWLSPSSSGEAQQHLMWEARYRLPSTQETSLRSRSEWKRFPAVLESLPLRAVRKHVKVKEFVEKVMEAVQDELTHKAKTEQRRLTRNTKKKGGEQQQQQRGSSPPPPGVGCGGSHRSSVKRMVKQKLEPRMVATCNLVRHVADDLIVSWREEHRVDLKLWLLEALRVFLSVKTRASKASAGVLAPEDSPPPMASPISSTVAGLASALRLEGDEPPEGEGEGEGEEDKRARKKQKEGCIGKKEGGWAWEDLDRAFRLHAAHLAEDLRRQEDMQEDATQVLLSLPKVRDFLQAYCRAVQGDSRGDGSLDGSGHSGRSGDSQHAGEDRGRRRANDCSSGGGGGGHARCASRSPVSGGGRTSPAGMGPRRGSSGSLRSSGSSSSCPPSTPRVPLTLSPSELDSLKLSQLDEVWAGLCGVAQSAGLELDKVLGNRAWVLILEEFRVHKLQSIDRVLRRLNKWLRICTGRISPDSARRRFKALLKALFKASGSGGGRTLKYQHFTATVLGILSNPSYSNDFERWDAVETSLASLVSTDQRSAFRSLLTDFLHCKHFTQAEIDADKRARWRTGSAASLETSGSSSSTGKAMRKANKTKRGWAIKGDVLALAVASGYHHEDEEGGAGLSIDAGPSMPHPPSCPCCADLSEGRGTPRIRPHSTSPSLSRSGSMRAMSGSLDGPIAGAASSSSKSLPRRPSRSASLSREDLLDVSREDEAMYREERRKEQQQQEKQVLRRAVAPSAPAPKAVAPAVPPARPGVAPPPPPMVPSASMPPMAMAAPAPQRFSSSALPVMPTLPAPMALPPPPPAPAVGGMVGKGGFVIAQDDEAEVACKPEAEEEEDAASSSSESEDEGLDGEGGPEEEGLIWLGAAVEDDDDDLVLLGKQGRPKAQDEEEEGESFVSSFFCDEGVRQEDDEEDDEEDDDCHHQEGGRRAWAGGQAARAGSTVSDVSTASDDSVPLRLLTSSSSASSLAALSSSEGAPTPSSALRDGAGGQEER